MSGQGINAEKEFELYIETLLVNEFTIILGVDKKLFRRQSRDNIEIS